MGRSAERSYPDFGGSKVARGTPGWHWSGHVGDRLRRVAHWRVKIRARPGEETCENCVPRHAGGDLVGWFPTVRAPLIDQPAELLGATWKSGDQDAVWMGNV